MTTTYVPLSVPLADREKEELLRIIERYQDNLAWYVGERNRLMARIGRPRGHYDVAVEIIGVFLEYRDKHGKSETEAKHCAATEYEESEE